MLINTGSHKHKERNEEPRINRRPRNRVQLRDQVTLHRKRREYRLEETWSILFSVYYCMVQLASTSQISRRGITSLDCLDMRRQSPVTCHKKIMLCYCYCKCFCSCYFFERVYLLPASHVPNETQYVLNCTKDGPLATSDASGRNLWLGIMEALKLTMNTDCMWSKNWWQKYFSKT